MKFLDLYIANTYWVMAMAKSVYALSHIILAHT